MIQTALRLWVDEKFLDGVVDLKVDERQPKVAKQ